MTMSDAYEARSPWLEYNLSQAVLARLQWALPRLNRGPPFV
jgi:hypothetical protein